MQSTQQVVLDTSLLALVWGPANLMNALLDKSTLWDPFIPIYIIYILITIFLYINKLF